MIRIVPSCFAQYTKYPLGHWLMHSPSTLTVCRQLSSDGHSTPAKKSSHHRSGWKRDGKHNLLSVGLTHTAQSMPLMPSLHPVSEPSPTHDSSGHGYKKWSSDRSTSLCLSSAKSRKFDQEMSSWSPSNAKSLTHHPFAALKRSTFGCSSIVGPGGHSTLFFGNTDAQGSHLLGVRPEGIDGWYCSNRPKFS